MDKVTSQEPPSHRPASVTDAAEAIQSAVEGVTPFKTSPSVTITTTAGPIVVESKPYRPLWDRPAVWMPVVFTLTILIAGPVGIAFLLTALGWISEHVMTGVVYGISCVSTFGFFLFLGVVIWKEAMKPSKLRPEPFAVQLDLNTGQMTYGRVWSRRRPLADVVAVQFITIIRVSRNAKYNRHSREQQVNLILNDPHCPRLHLGNYTDTDRAREVRNHYVGCLGVPVVEQVYVR
jgi:hypothetical protein